MYIYLFALQPDAYKYESQSVTEGTEYNVKSTHVVNPQDFWCQLNSQQCDKLVDDMTG